MKRAVQELRRDDPLTGRIALLFATSGHSGVDRVIGNLLPEFARTGRQFDLLVIRGHGPSVEEMPANVRVRRLPVSHRNPVSVVLAPYLWRNRPAALLTAGHPLNRAAVVSRMLARVPTRIVLRFGMSMEGKAGRLGERQYRRFVHSVRRWYPRADRIIVPSQGVAEGIRDVAPETGPRLERIPNPIVDEKLEMAAQVPLDDRWLAAGQPPVILGAGSLEPRKDFATLVRAFARLRQRRPARLVVLGDGEELPALEQLARQLGVGDDVRFPGFDANPYRWMARASVFALCSRYEGFGAVLVEALACGTPVIATDCPSGPREILGDGRFGPLVPVGDVEALTTGIERLLDQPTSGNLMTQAIAPFRVEQVARRYLEALGVNNDRAGNR